MTQLRSLSLGFLWALAGSNSSCSNFSVQSTYTQKKDKILTSLLNQGSLANCIFSYETETHDGDFITLTYIICLYLLVKSCLLLQVLFCVPCSEPQSTRAACGPGHHARSLLASHTASLPQVP